MTRHWTRCAALADAAADDRTGLLALSGYWSAEARRARLEGERCALPLTRAGTYRRLAFAQHLLPRGRILDALEGR